MAIVVQVTQLNKAGEQVDRGRPAEARRATSDENDA